MAVGSAVTGQRQTTVSNGVTYVPAMIIGFVTDGGNYGNITVTADKYTPDYIEAALGAAAEALDYVGNFNFLTANPAPTFG